MRRISFVILILVSFVLMLPGHSPLAEESEKAKLSIEAHPRQGLTPVNVLFTARLEGVSPNSPDFYCLKEEWDFGDGAISSEQVQCEPYSTNSKIKSEFFAEHEYWDEGNYQAQLTLGDNKVRTRRISIRVIEKGIQSRSRD